MGGCKTTPLAHVPKTSLRVSGQTWEQCVIISSINHNGDVTYGNG